MGWILEARRPAPELLSCKSSLAGQARRPFPKGGTSRYLAGCMGTNNGWKFEQVPALQSENGVSPRS
ncbi:hypothetical protein [Pseudacidovorax intermedius]|jgi:hypothetical protein|uniref:hypothetical protein n=1 Tax=Pseudacidovorax intermedius TaxID=433924 RepID=UPI0026EE6463|nr:hypothetical protein [Pseudacidovorax intermedius]